MHELVDKARQFATQAHGRIDQMRKYTGQPYDVHLRAVAEIVATVTDDDETLATAWLHDVVEDTPATFEELESEFGANVARLVAEVTDISRPSDGNRAARRALDRAHISEASPRGKTVKLADLIDNCPDICKHDARFGRVFLREMGAQLEVLGDGDARLMARARKVYEKYALELNVTIAPSSEAEPDTDSTEHEWRLRGWRFFARAFTALDIAEPLRSFDADRLATDVLERMRELGVGVVGVRRDGIVTGFARASDLTEGTLGDRARPIDRRRTIDGDRSLTEVIRVLTRHEQGFVTSLGAVIAMVTRNDIQKPLVRMWLFGMITLIEMKIVERIGTLFPEGDWLEHVPPKRLEKARELLAERERRGQPANLLDCLQFGDKVGILIKDENEVGAFGFESRKAAKRVIKELQSLRNNLAHAQDIITHDWAQIARLTARIEATVDDGA